MHNEGVLETVNRILRHCLTLVL